jgi:prepilin signal peptidase PulO-like enzyme (type II secretory pathway)
VPCSARRWPVKRESFNSAQLTFYFSSPDGGSCMAFTMLSPTISQAQECQSGSFHSTVARCVTSTCPPLQRVASTLSLCTSLCANIALAFCCTTVTPKLPLRVPVMHDLTFFVAAALITSSFEWTQILDLSLLAIRRNSQTNASIEDVCLVAT